MFKSIVKDIDFEKEPQKIFDEIFRRSEDEGN